MKQYSELGRACALAFLCIQSMHAIDHSYHFPLARFVALCKGRTSAFKGSLEADSKQMCEELLTLMYQHACYGLVYEHHIVLALCMALAMSKAQGVVAGTEVFLLLDSLAVSDPSTEEFNRPEWMPSHIWKHVQCISRLPAFRGLNKEIFQDHSGHFQHFCTSSTSDVSMLPREWQDRACPANRPAVLNAESTKQPFAHTLDTFNALLFWRVLRPDTLLSCARDFVSNVMGPRFIEPQVVNLDDTFSVTGPLAPILFVCRMGSLPITEIYALAALKGAKVDLLALSELRSVQSSAEELFQSAVDTGRWVLFTNCHMAASWMIRLDLLICSIPANHVHPNFRLLLATEPSERLPHCLLCRCVNLDFPEPSGLRKNVQCLLKDIQTAGLAERPPEKSRDAPLWPRILFSLTLFHVAVQERAKFGALAWHSKSRISRQCLLDALDAIRMQMRAHQALMLEQVEYLVCDCNYHSYVDDPNDCGVISIIFRCFMARVLTGPPESIEADVLSGWPTELPDSASFDDYQHYASTFPLDVSAHMCGLNSSHHLDAGISSAFGLLNCVKVVLHPSNAPPDFKLLAPSDLPVDSEWSLQMPSFEDAKAVVALPQMVKTRLLLHEGVHRFQARKLREQALADGTHMDATADAADVSAEGNPVPTAKSPRRGAAKLSKDAPARMRRRNGVVYTGPLQADLIMGLVLKLKGEISIIGSLERPVKISHHKFSDLREYCVWQEADRLASVLATISADVAELAAIYKGDETPTSLHLAMGSELLMRRVPVSWSRLTLSNRPDEPLEVWLMGLKKNIQWAIAWTN